MKKQWWLSVVFAALLCMATTLSGCNVNFFFQSCKHENVDIETLKAPTCQEDGERQFTCRKCGEKWTETVHAVAHTEQSIPPVPATCTQDGSENGLECAVCGKILREPEVVPAISHTWTEDEAVEPTCTSTGLTAGKHCRVCGTVETAQEEIPAKGHTPVVAGSGINPTCVSAGMTAKTICAVCGETMEEAHEIPPRAHVAVVDPAVEPTLTSTGLTEGSHCALCGTVLVAQEVIPVLTPPECSHEHSSSGVLRYPSCILAGSVKYTCDTCGAEWTESLPAKGHTPVIDPATEPTCVTPGYTTGAHCGVCDATLTARTLIPATGVHTPVIDPAVEATTNSTGLTEGSHCGVCGKIIKEQVVTPKKKNTDIGILPVG